MCFMGLTYFFFSLLQVFEVFFLCSLFIPLTNDSYRYYIGDWIIFCAALIHAEMIRLWLHTFTSVSYRLERVRVFCSWATLCRDDTALHLYFINYSMDLNSDDTALILNFYKCCMGLIELFFAAVPPPAQMIRPCIVCRTPALMSSLNTTAHNFVYFLLFYLG